MEENNCEEVKVQEKSSCRITTKSKKQLRLSAKRRRIGGKISSLPRSSNDHCEKQNYIVAFASEWLTIPPTKKSLPPSQKRKRKLLPANLMIGKMENKRLKLSSKEYPASSGGVESGFDLASSTSILPLLSPTHQGSKITIESASCSGPFSQGTVPVSDLETPPRRDFVLNSAGSEVTEEPTDNYLVTDPGPAVLKNIDLINSGNYIVNGQYFYRSMRKLELHRMHCLKSSKGYMQLISSSIIDMVWKMTFCCPYCQQQTTICSQPDHSRSNKKKLTLTQKTVWGFCSIGSGHENMEEVLSNMEIKTICPKSFRQAESHLGEVWSDVLFQKMKEAGEEEKNLAIEKGDVTEDGTPFITVIVDGGWSHRSHGHRYTANSGVSCVIGMRTQKILDLGIRNKYCSMCEYRDAQQLDPKHDKCYKNWDGASASMEKDMLVECFKRSKQLHGLEYHTVVGDGDSSVFYYLKTSVTYGRSIQKVECANHVVKNYTKRLYALQKESTTATKKLSNEIIRRLKAAARGAIAHNAEEGDVNSLKEDLKNGPLHVFGIHRFCKPYFCSKIGESIDLTKEEKEICDKARFLLQPVVLKSHQLITNSTSNAAEYYMSLVAKFTGGKQINRGKRGSFTHRTKAAGLDFQLKSYWHYETMKSMSNESPASIVKQTGEKKEKRRAACRRSLFKARQEGKNGRKVRSGAAYHKDSQKGLADYGVCAMQVDMEDSELTTMKEKKILQLSLNKEEIVELEIATRGQAESERWHMERKDRLTASNFGYVCKRQSNKWAPVAKKLLYGDFRSSAMMYGSENESRAIDCFQEKTGLIVEKCGLFVHPIHGFLGASPDGLVGEDSILEIKCPKSAKNMSIQEACNNIKNFCIDKKSLKLKKRSDYYYQIQGQLQLAGKRSCHFVVWTPKDMHHEIIHRDDDFWEKKMIQKLVFCYKEVLLPEILDPRMTRSMSIREPYI